MTFSVVDHSGQLSTTQPSSPSGMREKTGEKRVEFVVSDKEYLLRQKRKREIMVMAIYRFIYLRNK